MVVKRKRSHTPSGTWPRPRAGRESGTGWLYGLHAVHAALVNPARRCHRVVATREALAALGPALATRDAPGPTVEIVSRSDVARLLPPGAAHQGVALMVTPLPDSDLAIAAAPAGPGRTVVVVLDRLTDPHNVGAILRSAAAFGARAVITTTRHAPGATGALAKAASGALERVPLVRVVNLARALDALADLGYWRLGLAAEAPALLAKAVPGGAIAVVLGAEGRGLRRLTAAHCDDLVRLPTEPDMTSLNVSAAAAIALYELRHRS
jgi:23S rRNA (guanosine2251-2'-O)-methyltransferase